MHARKQEERDVFFAPATEKIGEMNVPASSPLFEGGLYGPGKREKTLCVGAKKKKTKGGPRTHKNRASGRGLEGKGVVESRAILNAFLYFFHLLLHKYFFFERGKGESRFFYKPANNAQWA